MFPVKQFPSGHSMLHVLNVIWPWHPEVWGCGRVSVWVHIAAMCSLAGENFNEVSLDVEAAATTSNGVTL